MFKLTHLQHKGRCLMATQPIPRGTTIIQERPFESSLVSDEYCIQCTRSIRQRDRRLYDGSNVDSSASCCDGSGCDTCDAGFMCEHCRMRLFCSRQCFQASEEHRTGTWECRAWGTLRDSAEQLDIDFGLLIMVFRICRRALDAADVEESGSSDDGCDSGDSGDGHVHSSTLEQVLALETHRNDIRPQHIHSFSRCSLVIREIMEDCCREYFKDQRLILSAETIVKLFCIIFVNAHGICPSDSDHDVGIGLYPLVSMISHDCRPNCCFSTRDDRTIVVSSIADIDAGEEICLSYVDLMQPTHVRRKTLLESKYFLCQCERCSSPSELGNYMRAYQCRMCLHEGRDHSSYLLPHYELSTTDEDNFNSGCLNGTTVISELSELDDDEFFDRYDQMIDRDGTTRLELPHKVRWQCEECAEHVGTDEHAMQISQAENTIKEFLQVGYDLDDHSLEWIEQRLHELEVLISRDTVVNCGVHPLPQLRPYMEMMHDNHFLRFLIVEQMLQCVAALLDRERPTERAYRCELLTKAVQYRDIGMTIIGHALPPYHFEVAEYLRTQAKNKLELASCIAESDPGRSSQLMQGAHDNLTSALEVFTTCFGPHSSDAKRTALQLKKLSDCSEHGRAKMYHHCLT